MTTATSQDYAATLLRAALGVLYLTHSAVLKLGVFGLAGTVGYFESLGLPGFAAHATIAVEIGAGVMLLLGWHTRLAALAVVPIALGAVWVHAGNGWVFSNAGGGWEFPAYLVVLSLVQALLGDGAYALSKPAGAHGMARRTATA